MYLNHNQSIFWISHAPAHDLVDALEAVRGYGSASYSLPTDAAVAALEDGSLWSEGDQEALEALHCALIVSSTDTAPEPWRFDEVYGSLYQRKTNGAPGGPAYYVQVFRSARARTLHEAVAEYFDSDLA
jgi:hypothetical protein